MFTSLPSPSAGSLEIGPLRFNAYGLMIALGVVAAVWLFKKRLAQRQIGKPDDAGSIAMIAVPFGIVGARAYHVLTDWERFSGRWFDVVKIWHGGLGVWGGISVGAKNIAGLRLNQWTSIIVFVFAIGYLLASRNNSKNSEIEAVSQDFRGSQD
ncbi:MAG: hypothetical protein EB142_00535 [Actinobacteria bacterium]|nr:hypothetical protein [Actinomycetota bacterium]